MRWYVGAMNDCLFIIDQPPRPSNDYINPDHDTNAIAKVCDLGPEGHRQARLMAAAPELLEAAIAVSAAHESGDGYMDDVFGREMINRLDLAIKKARGE